jgi:hypothetical protein
MNELVKRMMDNDFPPQWSRNGRVAASRLRLVDMLHARMQQSGLGHAVDTLIHKKEQLVAHPVGPSHCTDHTSQETVLSIRG